MEGTLKFNLFQPLPQPRELQAGVAELQADGGTKIWDFFLFFGVLSPVPVRLEKGIERNIGVYFLLVSISSVSFCDLK